MQRDGGIPTSPETPGMNALVLRLSSRMQELQVEFPDTFETNFEYRICSQLMLLPRTLEKLTAGGEHSVYQKVAKKNAQPLRRLLPKRPHLAFYEDLLIEAFNHINEKGKLDIRFTLLTEVYAAIQKKSDEIEQRGSLHPAVVIVGAGGTGLTVARQLLARGLNRDDILVVEKRGYLGGQMADTNMLPAPLLVAGNMSGENLLVNYKRLARKRFGGTTTDYKNGVMLSAFLAGVPVLLNHEVGEENGNVVRVERDLSNSLVVRSTKDPSSTKAIDTQAVIFAVGQQAVYGTLPPEEVSKLPEALQQRVYTASEFLKRLVTVHNLKDETEKYEEVRKLLHERIALVGVLDSAQQIAYTIASLLDQFEPETLHNLLRKVATTTKYPLITVYGGYANYQSLRDTFLPILRDSGHPIDRSDLIGYRHERVMHLDKGENTVGISGEEYGTVVFTGYRQEDLQRYIDGITDVNDIPYINRQTSTGKSMLARFSELGQLAGTRIFYAGMPFFREVRPPLISSDGQQAVRIAELVIKSLPLNTSKRRNI